MSTCLSRSIRHGFNQIQTGHLQLSISTALRPITSISKQKGITTRCNNNEHQPIRIPGSSICRSVTTPLRTQRRWKSTKVESTQNPLAGLWKPSQLQRLHYGSNSVKDHLLSCLPSESSKAFIVTGTSLANKTTLIKQVQELLGPKHHAQTYSKIGQHAPVAQLDEATDLVLKDETIDTIISVGGGSPIDSAKAISHRLSERKAGKFLYHIAIPTTLSAAECTLAAGYSKEDGLKVAVAHPRLVASVILYDAKFMLDTPPWLMMSTAMRSMDHAMELMCKAEIELRFSNIFTNSLQIILPQQRCHADKCASTQPASYSAIYQHTKPTRRMNKSSQGFNWLPSHHSASWL